MSDDAAGSATAERGLKGARRRSRTSRKTARASLRRIQGFLHQYPTLIPLIVLVVSVVVIFAGRRSRQVPVAAQPLGGAAAGDHRRHSGHGADAGDPHRRHRPVRGPHHGPVLGDHGSHRRRPIGVPVLIAFPARPCSPGWPAACSTACIVTMLRLPPFIVTLGTWSIFGALNTFYSNSETIRSQDMEAAAPFLLWLGKLFKLYDIGLFLGSTFPGSRAGWSPMARS